jgi:hypothetical protein
MVPTPYQSDGGPTTPPWICSGAMNAGVPLRSQAVPSESAETSPKSSSTTLPPGVTSTLAGFTSRCTRPAWCSAEIASTSWGSVARRRASSRLGPLRGATTMAPGSGVWPVPAAHARSADSVTLSSGSAGGPRVMASPPFGLAPGRT